MRGRAIVLNRQSFGEADQYIQFFTQDWGMITALARSARKSRRRYVGGLDVFCHDEIFIRGNPKERPYLIELTVLNSFSGLRDSLEKLIVAGRVVQWVRQLADTATPMPGIYQLVGQILSLFEKETDPSQLSWIELVFRLRLLTQLGLTPRLDHCVRCSEPAQDRMFFDVASGGILCSECLGSSYCPQEFFLGREERDFFRKADSLTLGQWSWSKKGEVKKAESLNHLLAQFGQYHTHVRLPF